MVRKSLPVVLACLFGLLAFPIPRQASAQVYPCPAGAGPGERFVGVSPGGRGVAPVPLCERVSGSAASPQASGVDYAAIAFHPDVVDVWATARMNGPGLANGQALDACKRALGEGCEVVGYSDGAMVVSVVKSGELAWAWAASKRKARKQMREYCEQGNLFCTEIAVLQSGDTYPRFSMQEVVNLREPANLVRKRYGAVAWPKDPKDHRAWVSTGHASAADAKTAAEGACREATAAGGECAIAATSGNGILAAFVSEDKQTMITGARTEQQVQEIMPALCKKHEMQNCIVDKVYQVAQPGTFLYKSRAWGQIAGSDLIGTEPVKGKQGSEPTF